MSIPNVSSGAVEGTAAQLGVASVLTQAPRQHRDRRYRGCIQSFRCPLFFYGDFQSSNVPTPPLQNSTTPSLDFFFSKFSTVSPVLENIRICDRNGRVINQLKSQHLAKKEPTESCRDRIIYMRSAKNLACACRRTDLTLSDL